MREAQVPAIEGSQESSRWPKLRRTTVAVVEPTEVRDGDDIAGALLHQARRWRIPVESHVRARLVVVGRVATQHTDQVALPERNDAVGALASDRSDHALGEGVLPRRLPGSALMSAGSWVIQRIVRS